jgi:tyrosine-specific transport protein
MSISKTIGGILLIVGTSIGAGMLALPIATAPLGLSHTIIILILSWLCMTQGALWMLSVSLRLPPGSNIISMAKSTLGAPGQIIAWFLYLFLLYALLSAYISGGSDVLGGILNYLHISLPSIITSILFTVFFSLIIYSGIRAVDYVNRGLMFGKLGIYALLVIIIAPHIQAHQWQQGTWHSLPESTMVLITSFGFASIIPSLRDYFHSDEQLLKKLIWIGSAIPLICYILWIATISGVVPREGLQTLMISNHATSGLTLALNQALHSQWITGFFSLFTSICMITAFLCVSLGLFDFLADGLNLEKKGSSGQFILLLTFGPPLAIVLFYPGIYIQALKYAGVCCVLLLLILPALMAWRARSLISLRKCANNDLF